MFNDTKAVAESSGQSHQVGLGISKNELKREIGVLLPRPGSGSETGWMKGEPVESGDLVTSVRI